MTATDRRDVLAVVAMLATATFALTVLYRQSLVCLLIICSIVVVARWRWPGRRELVAGFTGVALGPLAELAATQSGLWRYAVPDALGLPSWTLPMWWMFPIAVLRLGGALSETRVDRTPPLECAVFATASVVWLCSFGVSRPWLAFAGTALLTAAWLARRHRAPQLWVFLFASAIGPAVELIPVRAGAWGYPSGALFGLPIWLPTGYGVFGAALAELGRSLGEREQRRANVVAR